MSKPSALGLLLLLAASPALAQGSKSYTLAGNEVAVYNIVGEITVKGGAGAAVVVEVTPVGKDAGRLTVASGELRGLSALRVMFPEDRIVYPPLGRGSNSSFSIRDDGTWGDYKGHWRSRSEGRKITVRGDGTGLEAAATLRITVPAGKKVGIYLGVGRLDATNVDGELRLDAASADVTARGIRGGLDIDTGSGDVNVETAEGTISLDTGSGDVTISGMSGGTLSIDTGSGSVLGSQLTAKDLNIDTGSGDIRLDAVNTPRLSLDTGSGAVRADLAGPIEEVAVSTGSGDVTIRLPEGLGATVDLDTGSGDFTLDFPLELVRKSEGALRGRVGDGRGRIQIETGSGDINLIK